jgi:hypothetical protein
MYVSYSKLAFVKVDIINFKKEHKATSDLKLLFLTKIQTRIKKKRKGNSTTVRFFFDNCVLTKKLDGSGFSRFISKKATVIKNYIIKKATVSKLSKKLHWKKTTYIGKTTSMKI